MTRGPASIEQCYRVALADRPEILAALDRVHDAAWAAVDPDLLDLCRVRIAMLLGADESARVHGLPDDLVAALADGGVSERLSATQRAALAFTDQYVLDVASVDDEVAAALVDALGVDAVSNFVQALLVVEQRIRLSLAWSRLLPGVPA
jgi:alkylhydroperoxidase family enzyme